MHWKFTVSGTFKMGSDVVYPCQAIIETNDREPGSPFRFKGVGPLAQANEKGQFSTYFITYGADAHAVAPEKIVAFIKINKGQWEPIDVTVNKQGIYRISEYEIALNNLTVAIAKQ